MTSPQNAFKGILNPRANSYMLLPFPSSVPNGYIKCSNVSLETDEPLELFIEERRWETLWQGVESIYPGQIDRECVFHHLERALSNWICNNHEFTDQSLVERKADDFLDQVSNDIKHYTVYVPIVGLQVSGPETIIGKGSLHVNRESDLLEAISSFKERHPNNRYDLSACEEAPCYFEFTLSGHQKVVIRKAKKGADFSLGILRLLIASFYTDVYVPHSRPKIMGMLGALPQGEYEHIILKQTATSLINPRNIRASDSFQFYGKVKEVTQTHLQQINNLLSKPDNETSKRMRIAINWFAKATTANTIIDSFLMYAIAIESILSEGRTSKETYGDRIAFLTKPQNCNNLFPLGGQLSSTFTNDLVINPDPTGIIKTRVIDLFEIRNNIAHGNIDLEQNVSHQALNKYVDSLIDFETLARNTILAFVYGGWLSLTDFITEMNRWQETPAI